MKYKMKVKIFTVMKEFSFNIPNEQLNDLKYQLTKMEQNQDRFSEEHPYCKRECDYCCGGKHSECQSPKLCHDTDEKYYWVDLD